MQTEAEHEKDGKPRRIRKGMIKDETGSIEIELFSSLVVEVSNNTSYDFKKMRVQKFMNDRILKSTETTKVSKNDDVAIFVTDEELSVFSYEKTVKAKVVSIDLKTLAQTYLFAALLYVLIMQLLGVKNVITLHRKVNASRKQM